MGFLDNFDWKKTVAAVAPGLAAALGSPVAGLAVKVLVDALGLPADAGEEQIAAAVKNATPEQFIIIKEGERRFAIDMQKLDVDIFALVVKDKDSARNLQIQTRAKTPAVLSWVVVSATFLLEGSVFFGYYPTDVPEVVVGRILGTFDTALGIVLTYWLGAAFRDPANRSMPPLA